jgi:hypothetical protein
MNHPLPKNVPIKLLPLGCDRVIDRIQSWAVELKAAGFRYRFQFPNRHAVDK